MNAFAIIVAAGRGERLGTPRPKAFIELGGQPLLLLAALVFERAPSVDAVVVVVPKEEIEAAREMLTPVRKLKAVVAGGSRRQDSVLEGLKQAPDHFEGLVLVHDAARPLADVPLVERVKRVREGRVLETLNRDELGAAQTPQGFRFPVLVEAYEAAFRDHVTLTDEAMAVERLGGTVAAVPGSARNRKITTPEDLAWAEGVVTGLLRA